MGAETLLGELQPALTVTPAPFCAAQKKKFPFWEASKKVISRKFLDFAFLRFGGVLASDSLEKWTKRRENIRARSPQKLVYVAPQETLLLGGL